MWTANRSVLLLTISQADNHTNFKVVGIFVFNRILSVLAFFSRRVSNGCLSSCRLGESARGATAVARAISRGCRSLPLSSPRLARAAWLVHSVALSYLPRLSSCRPVGSPQNKGRSHQPNARAMRFSSPSRPKGRVDSFGSDDSFDVVSMDGSEGECLGVEIDDGLSVDDEQDDGDADCEWEDVTETEPDESQVDINLDEGFQDAIEAALGSCISEATEPIVTPPLFSPRRSAREALRAFYLARAKSSEESSKNYRTYVPQPASPPAVIAPLRAPQRFDVELYERITREENQRKAKAALREFYAQRDAAKAVRAAENRANERFVYKSQIGSSHFLGMPHGVPLVEVETSSNFTQSPWETTRFVSAT